MTLTQKGERDIHKKALDEVWWCMVVLRVNAIEEKSWPSKGGKKGQRKVNKGQAHKGCDRLHAPNQYLLKNAVIKKEGGRAKKAE